VALEGTPLDCIGPVGNGYRLREGARNVLCLGESHAAWALLPAILEADAAGLAVAFAMEAALERDLIPTGRLPANVEYHTATPDVAERGRLSLAGMLSWADMLLAAGSLAFYDRLALETEAARFRVAEGFAQVLYPATFLCGYGACQACVADVAGGRRRVCRRGPVFDLKDVVHAD
jgi:dihydroorotate dehydrogenase electron transfer subunit